MGQFLKRLSFHANAGDMDQAALVTWTSMIMKLIKGKTEGVCVVDSGCKSNYNNSEHSLSH